MKIIVKNTLVSVCLLAWLVQPLRAAPEASLVIRADCEGTAISPLLYGIFFEEINRGGDGGLYAEMLENRSFEDSAQAPVSWYGKGQAVLALDTSSPINPRNPTALRVELSGEGGCVMNGGFRNVGLAVTKGAGYKLSFFARSDHAFGGNLKARLAGRNGSTLAEETVKGLGSSWKKFEVMFTSAETDTAARLVLQGTSRGTLWLDMVSLFPAETWKNHSMRKDIAEIVAALKPGFVRFPGGCFVEGGDKLANAVRWKETVGPLEERRGNYCTWGYQTTGGFGTFEFFQWCEDLGAEPLYVINCGMSHLEQVPMDKMQEWVQDALDLVEYARGPVDSKWGSLRAKAGHPETFKLNYLEIGNENIGPKYQERYVLFHDAIKAKYPDIKLVANEPIAERNCDIVDLHGYRSPHDFRARAEEFNAYDRQAPKVYIGEYAAITPDCGLGNLQAALGEAAYLTGLERNADCVVMSSYAPLFLNPAWRRWAPCAIVLNQAKSYATPSFFVQTLFANHLGAVACPTRLTVEDSICEAPAGGISLGTWASQAEYKDIKVVRKDGSVVFDSVATPGMGPWRKNGGAWSVVEGALRQNDTRRACMILAGSVNWGSEYTLSLKARKLGGSEGFLIGFQLHLNDPGEKHWLNLGGWNNTRFALEGMGINGVLHEGHIEKDRWYDIRIDLEGDTVACFLDGQEILRQKQKTVRHLFATASKTKDGSELIMKVVNTSERPITTDIRIEGSVHLNPIGKMWVITGEQGSLENSFDQPRAIAPVESQIRGVTPRFERTFPARSVTVMRLGMQKRGTEKNEDVQK
jgi:alpha-L-arabinofuranosidase